MRVQVRGAKPGEPLYWRGQTFAQYTGRGWGEDVAAAGVSPSPSSGAGPAVVELHAAAAQEHPGVRAGRGGRRVRSCTRAGEPISADRPYQAT